MLKRLLGRESTPTIDSQTAYDLLSSPRRRWLVDEIAEATGPVTKRDLAERLAVAEAEADGIDAVDSQARKAAYVSLHQTHLPELDAAGIVEYDADRGLVRPTATCRELAAIKRTVGRQCGAADE